MKTINASATVDLIHKIGDSSQWYVTATGAIPYPYTRYYFIRAKTEKDAAFEGIKRFGDEMREKESEKCP